MFYGNQVQDTREMFFSSWRKYRQKQVLLPLEQQIVDVILLHPEYHSFLENQNSKEQEFFPEMGMANPFLHLGLHLALRDQIATDRPRGISSIYQQLLQKYQDILAVEHQMIEFLAECLWTAQRNNTPPDELSYIDSLRKLLD